MRALVWAAAVTMAVAGCSVLPAAPPPLDADFVPDSSPSPHIDINVAADGFTYQEHQSVRIRVGNCDGWATGSGWVLSENQVVTNQHVVDDALWIEVTTYDGHDYPVVTSQVAPVADLALLTLEPVFTEWAEWEILEPERGDEVYIVGYPEGQALHTSTGTYLSYVADDVGETDHDVMEVQAIVKHGNSGSPLFNDDGVVIGTVYAGDEVYAGLAWSNDHLADLLDGTVAWEPNDPSC